MMLHRANVSIYLFLTFIFGSYFSVGEDSCTQKPRDDEIEVMFRMFGFSPSCSLTALNACERDCQMNFTETLKYTEDSISNISKELTEIFSSLQGLKSCMRKKNSTTIVSEAEPRTLSSSRPKNCKEVYQNGDKISGVKTIFPHIFCPNQPVSVFCDQDTDGGGYMVIQRRTDAHSPREVFERDFNDYQNGFGNLTGEYWMGLDMIHISTDRQSTELRIDMEDAEGIKKYAKYDTFNVGSMSTNYMLKIGGYDGDAGDSLGPHNENMFSTADFDNDLHNGNCASMFKGGWWYTKCHSSNLNGLPTVGKTDIYASTIVWKTWRGYYYSLKNVVMMIRPK